jgi:hypothetical protein
MTNRTRKEFAEYVKMDVKSLADKIRYQEKKLGIEFGQDFEDTKTYTECEQLKICKLLDIPCFHVEVHTDVDSELMSEKQREMILRNFKQMSELISLIDDVDFVKLDGEFAHNVFKKLGQNYIDWAKTNKNAEYDFQYEKLTLISEYLAQRD